MTGLKRKGGACMEMENQWLRGSVANDKDGAVLYTRMDSDLQGSDDV